MITNLLKRIVNRLRRTVHAYRTSPFRDVAGLDERFIRQQSGIYLVENEQPDKTFDYLLVSERTPRQYRVNVTAAVIWEHCNGALTRPELQRILTELFQEAASVEKELLGILKFLWKHHLIVFSEDAPRINRYALDYVPLAGTRSAKADRLVDFCLGKYSDAAIPSCRKDPVYNRKHNIVLLEASSKQVTLSKFVGEGFTHRLDQKLTVEALIHQRSDIPPGLNCWLIRGDNSGRGSQEEMGIHVTSMRNPRLPFLVLLPSANRNRFLGPDLLKQMESLREAWTPWERKSNTAWWGGAMTGGFWSRQGALLSRRQLVLHYHEHPDDRVVLHPVVAAGHKDLPAEVCGKGNFTKASAFGHKCVMLLPGNDIASASSWVFCGNSVVMMPPPHIDHILYFELKPWTHFIPLEADPRDILDKLQWVIDNDSKARAIVERAHDHLRWLGGPEYLWACNEVLRRISKTYVQLPQAL